MNSNKLKAAVFALLLFVSGAAVGALGHRYYAQGAVNAKGAEDFRNQYVSEMRSRLKLTDRQVAQLQVILDQTRADFRALRESHHPDMVRIKNQQVQRVSAILSPKQTTEYQTMVSQREQNAKAQDERDRLEEQRQRDVHLRELAAH